MNKAGKVLVTIVAMGAIVGTAYGVQKGITLYKDRVFEEEREQRYVEITEVTQTHKNEIQEISQLSTEEIEQYITDNAYSEDYHASGLNIDPWTEDFSDETVESQSESDEENSDWEAGSVKDNVDRVAQLGKEAVEGLNGVSGNDLDTFVSGNSVSGNSVSGNTVSGNSISGTVSGNKIYLADRQRFRSSSEETALWIDADAKVLENNEEDFSSLKIACLGDSITDATNLQDVYSMDEYRQYSYPARLAEILGTEVENYGIGGSSYGRYWDHAFCERYTDIPEDTDIIIVMGGDNDGYCLHEDMVGSMNDREYRTLYGDLDELMRGLKENYPDAEVIFMTPMPNLLHDVLRKERPELLSQTVVVNAVTSLANEYGFEVIDLYNSNFFDSHDADIVSNYIPDSVHPNEEGYELFAKHVAAEIMRIHEEKESEDEDESKDESLPTPFESSEQAPSATPEASESPAASATPETSESPEASATPEASESPEASATPEASEGPEASETPETSESPEAPTPEDKEKTKESKKEIYAREQ